MSNSNQLILRVVLIVAAALASGLGAAQADCCSPVCDGTLCADGTTGTPCCGEGPCNIFCCNCDGGCRTGSALDRFRSIDGNKDNKISLTEFQSWAEGAKKLAGKNAESEFAKVDTNKDKFIQPGEFDKSLGKN